VIKFLVIELRVFFMTGWGRITVAGGAQEPTSNFPLEAEMTPVAVAHAVNGQDAEGREVLERHPLLVGREAGVPLHVLDGRVKPPAPVPRITDVDRRPKHQVVEHDGLVDSPELGDMLAAVRDSRPAGPPNLFHVAGEPVVDGSSAVPTTEGLTRRSLMGPGFRHTPFLRDFAI
jgi:hypothetical protein